MSYPFSCIKSFGVLPAFLLGLGRVDAGAGEVNVADRAGLVAALARAEAGTVIRLSPGTYVGGIHLSGIAGRKEAPVKVVAGDPQQPPVIEGGSSGMQLSGCSFVELHGLVFSGAADNGLNIDDGGGKGKPPAQGILLKGLRVTNKTAPKGNRDGIKLSGLSGFRIEGCTVERWGTGGSAVDMVGCRDGVVEHCTFQHDPDAAAEANGVQMKGGSEDVRVSRCRFLHTGARGVNLGGSTGADFFRPPGATWEARALTVEDCLFVGSAAPVAFVGVDGAKVQRNTLMYPGRWALRILQENQGAGMTRCRNGSFSGNLIVFRSSELREAVNAGPNTEQETFTYSENAWVCEDQPENTARIMRRRFEEKVDDYGKIPVFQDAGAGDYRQTDASPVKQAGMRPEK